MDENEPNVQAWRTARRRVPHTMAGGSRSKSLSSRVSRFRAMFFGVRYKAMHNKPGADAARVGGITRAVDTGRVQRVKEAPKVADNAPVPSSKLEKYGEEKCMRNAFGNELLNLHR